MVGNQFGFVFNSYKDIDQLLYNINQRLDDYFKDYNLSDGSIVYV